MFVLVGVGVGPALEQGADEAFGLAIGLRSVGAGLADSDLVAVAGFAPAAFEAGAVVGEDALDLDAVLEVPGAGAAQEGGAVCRAFSGKDLGVGEA